MFAWFSYFLKLSLFARAVSQFTTRLAVLALCPAFRATAPLCAPVQAGRVLSWLDLSSPRAFSSERWHASSCEYSLHESEGCRKGEQPPVSLKEDWPRFTIISSGACAEGEALAGGVERQGDHNSLLGLPPDPDRPAVSIICVKHELIQVASTRVACNLRTTAGVVFEWFSF